jgi:phage terminase small subunit
MSRPHKPISVIALSGGLKKNPKMYEERVANEPVPTGAVGDPPRHVCKAQKIIWREIVEQTGWLTSGDRIVLEMTCALLDKFRNPKMASKTVKKTDKEGNTTVTKEEWFETMQTSEVAVLKNLLSSLGMTATDRAKVQAPGTKETEEKKNDDPYGLAM